MPLLLIECPRLLFPFARQIIADATRQGGFPPLMIDPVDFAALYRQRMAEHERPAATGRPRSRAELAVPPSVDGSAACSARR